MHGGGGVVVFPWSWERGSRYSRGLATLAPWFSRPPLSLLAACFHSGCPEGRLQKELYNFPKFRLLFGRFSDAFPCPSFPCFLGKWQGKPTQKTRIFYPYRTLKIPANERKNARKKQGISRQGKKKTRNSPRTRKGRRGLSLICHLFRYVCRTPFAIRYRLSKIITETI